MRGLIRKLGAVAAMISALSLSAPPAALAGYGAADYVPPGSCAEQVAQATAAGATPEEVKLNLDAPWVYRYQIAGMTQSPREMIANAKSAEDAAASYQTRDARRDAATMLLRACVYRTAAANVTALARQLAPNGLVHRVTQSDCSREQEAYAIAYEDDARTWFPRPPVGAGREIAAGFVEGVAYNHVLYNNGRGMTPDVYQMIAKGYKPSGMAKFDAEYALSACLYGLAGQRGGSSPVAANTPPSPAAPAESCVGEPLSAANREITTVEVRLDRFMSESSYAKAEGSKPATPMLQVTIWALEQNIAALKQHCPSSQIASERIADLESSLKSAKAACDQIQSGGGKCVGIEPEKVT
jgi:hypothetical protein